MHLGNSNMPDILISENLIDHVLYFKRTIILRFVQPRNSRAGLYLVHGKANRKSINKWIYKCSDLLYYKFIGGWSQQTCVGLTFQTLIS